jgi:hypothetical protein
LKKAVQRLRYWHLRLRQARNLPVSINQLEHFKRDGEVTPEEQLLTSETDIKKAQNAAYKLLKELQAKHQDLRDSYLEDVAEAIILDRNPKLADPGLEPAKKEKVEKQIKQLLSREKASKMYRKIGKVLNKVVGKGLSRIDVPDAATKLLGTQISLRLGKALGGP